MNRNVSAENQLVLFVSVIVLVWLLTEIIV
jgi:hypothetical protein